MEWTKFNTHGESSNHAFEVMCNILFEGWCKREYKDNLKYFSFGRDIMHDTDRSFVVWHDEDEYKYVELQNIAPPRTEMKEYESIIKFYYSDIEE